LHARKLLVASFYTILANFENSKSGTVPVRHARCYRGGE